MKCASTLSLRGTLPYQQQEKATYDRIICIVQLSKATNSPPVLFKLGMTSRGLHSGLVSSCAVVSTQRHLNIFLSKQLVCNSAFRTTGNASPLILRWHSWCLLPRSPQISRRSKTRLLLVRTRNTDLTL